MRPTTPPLPELLTDLVASGDPLKVACGHNYLFEDRVAADRRYESGQKDFGEEIVEGNHG